MKRNHKPEKVTDIKLIAGQVLMKTAREQYQGNAFHGVGWLGQKIINLNRCRKARKFSRTLNSRGLPTTLKPQPLFPFKWQNKSALAYGATFFPTPSALPLVTFGQWAQSEVYALLHWIISFMPIGVLAYGLIGSSVTLFINIGDRLSRFEKPDQPTKSLVIRLLSSSCLVWPGYLLLILIALTLLALVCLGVMTHQLAEFLRWLTWPFLSFVFGSLLAQLASLYLVIHAIPQQERKAVGVGYQELLEKLRKLPPFDPRTYIDINRGCFAGLNLEREPIFIPWSRLQGGHCQVMGETGSGKGALSGVILSQCIEVGESVCFIDPKGDPYTPTVLNETARRFRKRFAYIDLRPTAPPQISLLKGSLAHEIQEMLVAGFSLMATGTDGDFHRGGDQDAARAAAALAIEKGIASIPELAIACQKDETINQHENFMRKMRALATLPAINTAEGIDLKNYIESGDVIYIVGSTDNEDVKMLQKLVLVKLLQIIKSPDRSSNSPPVAMLLDEFKYVLSPTALSALGVVRSFRCHILLCHQSLGDLSECPGIDPASAYGAVVDNTSLKLIYKVGDHDHAKKIAALTGQRKGFIESRAQSVSKSDIPEARWNEVFVDRFPAGLITSLPVPDKNTGRPPIGILLGLDTAQIFHVSPMPALGEAPKPTPAVPSVRNIEGFLGEELI